MASSPKSSLQEDYYIQLAGLPRTYDWKALKDLAKNACKTVGWAEIRICRGPYVGTAGDLKIKGRREARNLYDYLIGVRFGGNLLTASLWDISPGHDARLLASTDPNLRVSDVVHMRSVVVQRTTQPVWDPLSPVQYAMHNGCEAPILHVAARVNGMEMTDEGYSIGLTPPLQSCQYEYRQSVSQSPMVQSPVTKHCPSWNLHAQSPVNATSGIVITEHRTIFVSNLDWAINESDIQNFLREGGDLVTWDFANPKSNQPRGCALATYSSKEDAVYARRTLDQRVLGKNRVIVRLSRDAERASGHGDCAKIVSSKKERVVSSQKPSGRGARDYAVKKSTDLSRQDSPVIANGSAIR